MEKTNHSVTYVATGFTWLLRSIMEEDAAKRVSGAYPVVVGAASELASGGRNLPARRDRDGAARSAGGITITLAGTDGPCFRRAFGFGRGPPADPRGTGDGAHRRDPPARAPDPLGAAWLLVGTAELHDLFNVAFVIVKYRVPHDLLSPAAIRVVHRLAVCTPPGCTSPADAYRYPNASPSRVDQ